MPNCSGCHARIRLVGGNLDFTFTALPSSARAGGSADGSRPEMRTITAVVAQEFSQADLNRLITKVQAFYNRLTADEQVVLEAVLR